MNWFEKKLTWFEKNWEQIIAAGIVLTFTSILLWVWLASPLKTSDRVGITTALGTLALVFATAVYAYHTRKMAEEMKEQRYDALRPVIDFVVTESKPMDKDIVAEGVTDKKKENTILACGLRCVLWNIGVGPAIDICSFTLKVSGGRSRQDFGTLTIKQKTALEIPLRLEQRGDRWFLVAYYRDVYDLCFESSREVGIDNERSAWSIGPLKIRKIAEEGFPK